MFSVYGTVRSVLVKVANQQNVTAILMPTYASAYVQFDTEEQALQAFDIAKNPGQTIKVQHYNRDSKSANYMPPNMQANADVIGNVHYCRLFLTKINKSVTEEQLTEICGKYGKVSQCKLMIGQDRQGNTISLGKATVAYSTKDEAAEAQKKLHFEDSLGEYFQVDFYKAKQLRMTEQQNVLNINDNIRMLANHMMRNHNNAQGYGAGNGQYYNRGYQGYSNNQQRDNRYGGQNQQMNSAAGMGAGAGRYQNQQQNS